MEHDREKQFGFKHTHGGREPFADSGWSKSEHSESGSFDRPYDPDAKTNFTGKGPIGYQDSDEQLKREACEALSRNPRVAGRHIEVSVKDGCVTLSGTVASREDKQEAERCVEHLMGVHDVYNDLRFSFRV